MEKLAENQNHRTTKITNKSIMNAWFGFLALPLCIHTHEERTFCIQEFLRKAREKKMQMSEVKLASILTHSGTQYGVTSQ